MLYVIPFVILLVVLLILKKRENANNEQGSEKSKKTNVKKTNKKTPSRTGRSTTPTSVSSVTATPTEPQVKSLDPELKNSIESLIQSESYFSAEAKINQALNQDNTQHELYLYLLDIHLAQKDEFAIKQLINYLRSLGLHDIADQADLKHRQSLTSSQDHHSQQSLTTPTKTATQTRAVDSTAAFDELIDLNTSTHSFEQPQEQPKTKNEPVEQSFADDKGYDPIEYTFEKKPTPSTEQSQPLDFNLHSEPQVESAELSEATTQTPEADSVGQTSIQETPPLEFSFTSVQEKETTKAPPLKEDFVFDEKTASSDSVDNAFKLDFEAPKLTPSAPEPEPIVLDPVPEFTFSLDTPLPADPQPLNFESPAFDTATYTTQSDDVREATHTDDPLAQSFPELLQVNEIQLNLDLAAKYIELGAYESARQLLSQNEADYSSEQRDLSQKLLNQIAS